MQGSILGLLLLLVYLSYLPKGLLPNAKLLADGTLIFSTVQHLLISMTKLNKDLTKISTVYNRLKGLFYFLTRLSAIPLLRFFNNIPIQKDKKVNL